MRSFSLLALVVLGCGGAATAADASVDLSAADTRVDVSAEAATADAPASDAATPCNPAAVVFPQGGALSAGTLCDELYACADDAAGAARIAAASPRFSCAPGSEPGSTCTAYTCALRDPGGPSTLDASEIADICALTLLTPAPPLRCVVFINGPA